MSSRFGMRLCAASFSLAWIGFASATSAHVSVSSDDAEPGWTANLNKTRHDKPGDGIAPGQFDVFALSVGPIPKAASTVSAGGLAVAAPVQAAAEVALGLRNTGRNV